MTSLKNNVFSVWNDFEKMVKIGHIMHYSWDIIINGFSAILTLSYKRGNQRGQRSVLNMAIGES